MKKVGLISREKKFPLFNEKTDIFNLVFKVGLEFKTHDLFRNAVKEYSMKRERKFDLSKVIGIW